MMSKTIHNYTPDTVIAWTSNVDGGDAGEFELGESYGDIQLAHMSKEEIEEAIHESVIDATSEKLDIAWEIK